MTPRPTSRRRWRGGTAARALAILPPAHSARHVPARRCWHRGADCRLRWLEQRRRYRPRQCPQHCRGPSRAAMRAAARRPGVWQAGPGGRAHDIPAPNLAAARLPHSLVAYGHASLAGFPAQPHAASHRHIRANRAAYAGHPPRHYRPAQQPRLQPGRPAGAGASRTHCRASIPPPSTPWTPSSASTPPSSAI